MSRLPRATCLIFFRIFELSEKNHFHNASHHPDSLQYWAIDEHAFLRWQSGGNESLYRHRSLNLRHATI